MFPAAPPPARKNIAVTSFSLSPADTARAGQGVENIYLGLKSGLLDQFSSVFGKKNAMILSDFRSVEVLRTVSLPEGYSIVVINSMKKHNLVDSEYNVRRQDCEEAAQIMTQIVPDSTCSARRKTLSDILSRAQLSCSQLISRSVVESGTI